MLSLLCQIIVQFIPYYLLQQSSSIFRKIGHSPLAFTLLKFVDLDGQGLKIDGPPKQLTISSLLLAELFSTKEMYFLIYWIKKL